MWVTAAVRLNELGQVWTSVCQSTGAPQCGGGGAGRRLEVLEGRAVRLDIHKAASVLLNFATTIKL